MKFAASVLLAMALATPLRAGDSDGHPTLHATRITSPITIDGDLSDPGWKQAARIAAKTVRDPLAGGKRVLRFAQDDR